MAEAPEEVRLRLLRADDRPPSHALNEPYVFGLQDVDGQLTMATAWAGGGLAFEFSLKVRPGGDGGRPNFLGRFASGPAGDRFVYLAWRSVPRGVWINRVKARLAAIDWEMVRASQASGRPLEADMTGWTPHDGRRQVPWRLAAH